MRIVLDLEANSLVNPTNIWVIVCKDIDNGNNVDGLFTFRFTGEKDEEEKERFLDFATRVNTWIGHNILEYDFPVLSNLTNFRYNVDDCYDTLILSRLIDFSRNSHSIESYGQEFNYPKIKFNDFKQYSQELEDYCVRDVEICHKIYIKYLKYINNPTNQSAIRTEHSFQTVVNNLHNNGFAFNVDKANKLLKQVTDELSVLDREITDAFPPRLHLKKVITPRRTRYGTLHKGDFRWLSSGDLCEYTGGPFCRCEWKDFNANSPKQIIEVLHQAGWKPVDKTKGHIEQERELNKLKRLKNKQEGVDLKIEECYNILQSKKKYGWKVNENNLSTLPPTAPSPARLLARRILLESRRRTLTEWLSLCSPDGRIHGKFFGIGAWTHRMAHRNPNTANIPNEFKENGEKKFLGKELRSCWIAPKKRLLIGVDAEGIQLRIFAHYINDPEFTKALVSGSKKDKTDAHSLNRSILGRVCKSRQAAKRFIYSMLLGGGPDKFAEILECSREDADTALQNIMDRYQGFTYLKQEVIPSDAKRGWFRGLDGRMVAIPGETIGERKHLLMSGYLQNGEKVIMERATLKWESKLKDYDCKLVNLVHDEWQVEGPNNMTICLEVAKMMADSLTEVGEDLGLLCPMAGSYYNEDIKDYTIGTNWSVTH